MASDLIYREDAKDFVRHAYHKGLNPMEYLDEVPVADVVARDCYDRILAENDTMRNQLAKVGKKVGDSMDDVWPVTRAHWEWDENGIDGGLGVWKCSHCHCKAETWWATKKYSPLHCAGSHFCGNCGAEMR